MNVQLIRVDPYDPNLGGLVALVAGRIRDFAREYSPEADPNAVLQSFMVPLWQRAPDILVLAMVNDQMSLVGHAVFTINTDGARYWMTGQQTKADGAVGDAVHRCLAYAREWVAREINPKLVTRGVTPITRFRIVTGRNEKAWERAYGLKVEGRILAGNLDELVGERESEE